MFSDHTLWLDTFFLYLGIYTTDTCIPRHYGLGFVSRSLKSPLAWTLGGSVIGDFFLFQDLSNSVSPPAEPVVYLWLIKLLKILVLI